MVNLVNFVNHQVTTAPLYRLISELEIKCLDIPTVNSSFKVDQAVIFCEPHSITQNCAVLKKSQKS